MLCKIIDCSNSKGRIYLPECLQDEKNILKENTINISVGQRSKKVKIIIKPELNSDEIEISTDVLKNLSIPTDILYQVKIDESGIKIGPVIGLLFAVSNKKLTPEKLNNFIKYLLLYSEFHGLVYVFSFEGINIDTESIEGFYFNPNNNESVWQKGVFPYPDAVYRRVSTSSSKVGKLIEGTKNNVFNSSYFNKWKFWKMSSQNDLVSDNIPYTELSGNFKVVDNMLKIYKDIYLKLVDGSQGIEVIKITKTENNYLFQSKNDKKPIKFNTREEAKEYVTKKIAKRRYIAQQGINILKFEERCTDFRVIMQKDQTLKWKCTAIISHFGTPGGMSSIYRENGYSLSFEKFCSKVLPNLRKSEVFIKKEEIIRVCKKACEMLDESGGNYGDLGIDVVLDENLKVWIIEINKRHDHLVALALNDHQIYYSVKNNPIKYALGLSGFSFL